MSQLPSPPAGPFPPPLSPRPDVPALIRANALSFLVGAALCLYFGWNWTETWPDNVDAKQQQFWISLDHAYAWTLRGLGALFLIASGLAAAGRRASLMMGALTEGLFVLFMILLSAGQTWEMRIIGGWDQMVVLYLLFAVLAAANLRTLLAQRRLALRGPATPRPDVPHEP